VVIDFSSVFNYRLFVVLNHLSRSESYGGKIYIIVGEYGIPTKPQSNVNVFSGMYNDVIIMRIDNSQGL